MFFLLPIIFDMKKLQEYAKKRNFNKTSEPKPKKSQKNSKNALIFVIQWHNASHLHFDFRLQWKGALLSWAVPKGPSFNKKDKRLAVKVEDHPLDYADFEGNIPKGEYGGGQVMIWDKGTYAPLEDFDRGLKEGSLKFEMYGQRIKGKWALVRMQNHEEKGDNWLLIKEEDEFAKASVGISKFKTSVVSGKTFSQIKSGQSCVKNPFTKAQVMLATLVNEIPKSKGWLYEIKFDGYRTLAFIQNSKVKLLSRNGKDFSSKFTAVQQSLQQFFDGKAAVLDGEMVVLDEQGRTDFGALQTYVTHPENKTLVYMVFDMLAYQGEDLRKKPLIQRKHLLKRVLKGAPKNIMYSDHITQNAQKFFDEAQKLGLEGIVGKRTDSEYVGRRSEDWIKIKCYRRQEFVIGGFVLSSKKSEGVSSLLLGVMEEGKLKYIGRTGTGFNLAEGKRLANLLKKHAEQKSPFSNKVPKRKDEQLFFTKPKYICEVQYAEITDDGWLRQASFKGLREDKAASDVVLEEKPQPQVLGVKITSPDRIAFKDKKITKMQVIEYYERVADAMMPFLQNRVLSVVRCNDGVEGECFFKKHQQSLNEGIKNIKITSSSGEQDEYFFICAKSGIISEAQMGTIEFHTWGSKVNAIDKPDMMVFDLDPDKGMPLEKVRQGVKDLKKVLSSLSLTSFLKTSGGKGYHVVVPFSKCKDWQTFHDFAKRIAELMESKWPQKYTSNVRKDARAGKIFIDWIRNGKGATSVAPYSLRARGGAKVSMPISWAELDSVAPDGIDMQEAVRRLKKTSPWKKFYEIKQELK